jgi:PAS domain S-box-containing protein
MNVLFEWKLPASYTGSLAKSDVQFNQAVDITLMPNAHTFLTPDVLWMNVIADLLIALSFFTIPVGIYYLIRRRQDLKQAKFIFVLFISFIVLCGLTHLLEAITIWQPLYRLAATLKGMTAIVSVATAIIIWPLIPRIIKIPSSSELSAANFRLQQQVADKLKAEKALHEHKENLEHLIQARTLDLEDTAKSLQNEIKNHREAQAQIGFQASLLDQVNSAIVATNMQFDIIYWNSFAEKLFGWKREEVLGKSVSEIMIRKEHKRVGLRLLDKFRNRKFWSGELTIPHKSGRKIPVEITTSALYNAEEEQIGFATVAVDITNHVRYERKLQREKEKAEKQAIAKQDFLATMSHEIRTPLNVIIGMSRLLNDSKPRSDQEEYLKSLRFSASHLLTIINDILDLAKIDAGKIKIEKISFDVREVVEGVFNAFSPRADEKQLDLRVDIDSSTPGRVLGDQVRLTQVLNNLLSNAIKFTEQGFVKIKVRAEKQSQANCRLHFDVIDSGIGISADKIEQIFESFTQEKEETTRKFGGTGLGLTICKKLIRLQGGSINVNSHEGIGSTFSFSLDYAIDQEVHQPQQIQAVEQYNFHNIRLLLVDDNQANCVVASNFLSKMGIRVNFAENGQKALQAVQEQEFDIILMDLQMPVMDGYEATQAIRKLGGKYEVLPIIALTADVVSDVREKVRKSGMNDYLSKPIDPDQMNRTIARHLKLHGDVPDEEAAAQNILTLCQILEDYSDDIQFVTTLLNSLKSSFLQLNRQIQETAEQRDVESLRKIIHKLNPTIKMMENQALHTRLLDLREALSKEEINETEIIALLHQIHSHTSESLVMLEELSQKTSNQKAKSF